MYAQIINDLEGKTLVAASTAVTGAEKMTGVKAAAHVGQLIAQKAKAKGIKQVVFDRSSRPYMGQIKALAEKAREEGLQF